MNTLPKNSKQILNSEQLFQKIRRMAYQIFENNFEEESIVIAGIDSGGEGYTFSKHLAREISNIASIKVDLVKISIDKISSQQPAIQLDVPPSVYENKVVIMADDVLNTGRTLIFSLQPFLSVPLRKLQVAVIIDRDHDCYPIDATYVGYSLSTSLNEHVRVVLNDKDNNGVYVF